MRLLVGGYTADMEGTAGGIGLLTAGDADATAAGSLVWRGTAVAAPSPSWIARHPTLDVVYATLEGAGAVQAFTAYGADAWKPLGEPVPVGAASCHILVGRERLFVTCWGDGRVVQLDLDAEGRLRRAVTADAASDPYAGYDEHARVSHAHQSIVVAPGVVATTDMGFDLVRFWRTGSGAPRLLQEVTMPRGCGPRHGILHPSGHLYIVAELSCELFVLAPDETGTWGVVGGTPLGSGTLDGDTAAELAPSRDGTVLYAGVRGSNTIAVLRVTGEGETVTPLALVEAQVDWPRHHLVLPDGLLVAGQRSDEVVALPVDPRGVPGRARARTEVPSPTCLLPLA
ncbi:lactonase family protein [Microbacterium sp. bgisy207]|uniref:lactonase family protein n=1 Tax=Microbacterium sp. bgisy207 TaxID=3413800 RepID=UPI003EB9D85E